MPKINVKTNIHDISQVLSVVSPHQTAGPTGAGTNCAPKAHLLQTGVDLRDFFDGLLWRQLFAFTSTTACQLDNAVF
ncbi:hypothetical protein CLV88_101472 [Shimia abyssi]|uniref:Uncharacterized protein n=1 Tax=Shimia abyssi TaxID=1662395 RepID=A0A2P8FJZ5_9RHOB|nr:hypothetical protein CLV88_101472 [Shimia abyssi]